MAVSSPAHARPWITTARVRRFAVPVVGLLLVVGATVGALPARYAFVAGVAMVAGWAGVILIRTGLAIHRAERAFASCRGASLTGMGGLLAGATVIAGVLGPAASRHAVSVLGLAGAATLYVFGALLLPGAATTVSARLRRAFDGLGLAVSLAFLAWLTAPVGHSHPAVLVGSLCGAAGIAVVTVTTLRAVRHRRAALRCGGGAVSVITGLCAGVTVLAYPVPAAAFAATGLPIIAGLALTVSGATRMEPVRALDSRDGEPHLSGYPLLAVPAGLGIVAAVYHLITVGTLDRVGVTLGITMVSVLTVRELLAVKDIRRYARRLAVHEAHFRSLVSGATDLTLVLDEQMTVRWQSSAAARLFGLADADVVGRAFPELIHPDDVPDVLAVFGAVLAGEQAAGPPSLVAARLRDGHGLWRDTESTISDQRSVPEVAGLVVHVRDVGERRHLERTLHQMSYTDQLTGLANRRALMRDVDERGREPGRAAAVLVIDLHGVAEINEARGREVGDAVLIEVGRRIRAQIGEEDVAARLGGDEFAVVTGDGAVLGYALGTRLVGALIEPYRLPGVTVELHASVGLAEVAAGLSADDVLRHADLASRRARQLGRDRVEWYDTDLEVQLDRRMDLERGIIGAAGRGELDLVFQPVLRLRDGRPVGTEALLRWRHPEFGTVMPAELLPVAESVGVAGEIGEWVINAACRQLARWSGVDPGLWMSVNISSQELLAATFPGRVQAALESHQLAAERLVVEVAETWVAEDVPAVVAALARIRRLGVRAALDDFGAGHASLAHLRRLPVDLLKLDRALVNPPAERATGNQGVIDVVVSLGRRLGLEIIAEGLESAAEIELARHAGCAYGQGFALSMPAPAERVEAFLEERRSVS